MLELDVWTIIFSIVNIIVLFLFLKKFLFGKVDAILAKRQAAVQEDFDRAKESEEEARALKEKYESGIQNAESEAQKIVQDARAQANDEANEILANAQAQADKMLEDAQNEIDREREETLEGINVEIADLALAAASKVLESNTDDDKNRELVNAFLNEEDM